MTEASRKGEKVLGTFIDALNWNDSIETISNWGVSRESRTVCLCNVHSSVTAMSHNSLTNALTESDMVLPDGAPVAWMLRKKGFNHQHRIAGPDLMVKLCKSIENTGISIFLFGSTTETLHELENNLRAKFPSLKISGALSPKYGDWSAEDESNYIQTINDSGAGIIFIGLGCPKQEIWMAKNRHNVNGVMLGVGAAFDFHAGKIKRAPLVFQKLGLEWLHRLLSEPRRLWKRYLVTNSKFIWHSSIELLIPKKSDL